MEFQSTFFNRNFDNKYIIIITPLLSYYILIPCHSPFLSSRLHQASAPAWWRRSSTDAWSAWRSSAAWRCPRMSWRTSIVALDSSTRCPSLWAATGGVTVERWRKIWHQVCWDGMDRDMFYSFFWEKAGRLGVWHVWQAKMVSPDDSIT